jgi:phage terminase large subunit-like protein
LQAFVATERSDRIIRFIERYLVTPEGTHVGKPIRLRGWQKDIIRQIYDTPTRQAIVTMGRKNGKTSLIAMLVIAHMMVRDVAEANSHIFSAAQSRDQAAIVFGLAAKMVRMSDLGDPAMPRIVVKDSAKELFCPESGIRYKALSAEASTAFGVSPALVIHDELGQVRGPVSPLYDALETAMGAHPHPLSIVISTQAPTSADLLSQLIDYAKMGADPRTKLIILSAPEDAPLDDEATWRLANPALGDFLNIEELRAAAEKAMRMPSFESAFRNLHLNQRVSAFAQLFSLSVWEGNGGEPDMDAFARGPVYGGLDLSGRQDLTSLVLVAEGPPGIWNVWAHFWTPAETLRDRAQRDRAPYDAWTKAGLITAVPGVTIDYGFVAARLGELRKKCNIKMINFDRWRIDELKSACIAIGLGDLPFAEYGQGYRDMGPALDGLETVALQHRLRHGMHPVMTMCAVNAQVVTDPAGNRKFEKAKSSGRIDGMQALAMAVAGAVQNTTPHMGLLIA